MSTHSQIESDLVSALKSHDELKASVLRMIKNALKNKEIEKRKELTKEEVGAVLNKEIKQRKDSIEQFKKGRRDDLAQKEEKEIQIIFQYLPKQLNETELNQYIQEAISTTGAESPADFGKVMGVLMPQLKGKADGQKVANLVKSKLSAK